METTEPNTKYFLYARKSSESEDRQMASIESQIEELTKLAKQNDLDILEVFSESMSAKAPGRPIYNEMMARIKKGEAKGVVCWKLNRLARNPVDGGEISWMLQQGIIQHILTFGRSYYPTDNVIVMAVELGMANQFIRELSVDTKRGLRSKAERGWLPGYPPLGYIHNPVKKKGEKEIMQDPDRFDIVKRMFRLVLDQEYTPPQILRMATNKWGLRNKMDKKVARSTWYRILESPFYAGTFEYPVGSGKWYEGKHQPVITWEEYEKIQEIIGRKDRPRPKKHMFRYTGLMKCGECGAAVTAEKKIKRQKSGKIHFYTYYHCTKRKNPNCTQRVVEEKTLEDQAMEFLQEIEMPLMFVQWAVGKLRQQQVSEHKDKESIIESQKRQFEAFETRLSRLLDMRMDGEITEQEYARKKEEISKEKAALEKEMRKADNQEDWLGKIERSLNFAVDAAERFKRDDKARKRILLELGSNHMILDRKLNVKAEKPFSEIKKPAQAVREIHARFEQQEMPINSFSQ